MLMFTDLFNDIGVHRVIFVVIWSVRTNVFILVPCEFFLFNLEIIDFFIDSNNNLSDFSFSIWINEFIIHVIITFFSSFTLEFIELLNNIIQSIVKLGHVVNSFTNANWDSAIVELFFHLLDCVFGIVGDLLHLFNDLNFLFEINNDSIKSSIVVSFSTLSNEFVYMIFSVGEISVNLLESGLVLFQKLGLSGDLVC